MNNNNEIPNTGQEQENEGGGSYLKVMGIFCAVMAVVITAMYYLFNYLF